MMKLVYAFTGFDSHYPSYVNVSAEPGSDLIRVIVRGPAQVVDSENGAYFTAGHQAETRLTEEHALDLAKEIQKHFASKNHVPLDPRGEYGIGPALRAQFFPLDFAGTEHAVRTVVEEETKVGEISSVRRLIVDSIESEPLATQVVRLAQFIIENFESEPETSDGAVDTAIRLLGNYARIEKRRRNTLAKMEKEATDKIARGLGDGQDRHVRHETQDETLSTEFVSVGTQAKPVSDATLDKLFEEHVTMYTAPMMPVYETNSVGFEEFQAALSLPPVIDPAPKPTFFPDERAYEPAKIEPPAPGFVPEDSGSIDVVGPQPGDDEIPF